jgi:putative FmdB family regulatory protein
MAGAAVPPMLVSCSKGVVPVAFFLDFRANRRFALPIYEYQCGQCRHQYEKKEGFDAPVEQACPVCGGLARRLLHAPGIVFKGPGFYVTDNRENHEREPVDMEGKEEKPSPEGPSEVSAKK